MIAAAELDPPRFVEQFNLLKQATCKAPNGCARAAMVPQHSHMSEVYAINAAGSRLTDEILDFLKTGMAGAICTAPRSSPRSGR
jgi:hypothetical protein